MYRRRNPTGSSLSDVRFRLTGRRNLWKQSCKGIFMKENIASKDISSLSPCSQVSMNMFRWVFFIQSDEEYIASLLSWTQANKNSSCIRKSSLLQFWSPGKRVGDLWVLYESQEGELSHNRHDPPAYSGIQGVIFDLLHTFHPRPFLQTRFEPRGGYAVLRAHDGNIVDIFLRYSDYFHLIIRYWVVL